ncbi:rap GTPase-activating protein, putative [Entamoeba invadens IP1]|uniref:rap GTPase-activating protein, putative n=1 Tax=Entamoeba invadens IP1 TaxID=370355 RepID=UPI0002C3DDC7|nr:rap GTPase-activating protein, putative [Entamoeba invadens IP1]ELP85060.1 rap GTPase-activating protein, putative [Entamoeba invadens IP1]|eukprot:XP_004184406.1 rap GTPase-activating protein, putative [Entamoeba invadens IP1]
MSRGTTTIGKRTSPKPEGSEAPTAVPRADSPLELDSRKSFGSTEESAQHIVQLEETVHLLSEENDKLRAQISQMPTTPLNMKREFDYFCTQMPIRGCSFLTGQIDVRTTFIQSVITVSFPTPFPEDPVVFIFHLSVTGSSTEIKPTSSTLSSFTVDFKKQSSVPITELSCVFWIAYLPTKVKPKFMELSNFLTGTQTPSPKQAESQVVSYIKKHGVRDEDKNGDTLLHMLIILGYTNLVEMVIAKGADVNALNKFRYSPLHTALSQHEINNDIVTCLLNNKADRYIKNETMRTPLHYLCRNPKLDDKTISLLYVMLGDSKDKPEKTKEYINEISKLGETALTCLCASSLNEEAIKFLCENGANVNQMTESGTFPLYYAVKAKNTNVMQTLLQYGADIDMAFKGKPVMKIAEENGQFNVLFNMIEDKYSLRLLSNEEINNMRMKFENDVPQEMESWTNNTTQSKTLLINTATLPDYHIENFYTSCTHKQEIFMNKNYHDPTLPITFFQTYMLKDPHSSYGLEVVDVNTNTREKMVVTIKNDPADRKVIVWTKRTNRRMIASKVNEKTSDAQILKNLGCKNVPKPFDNKVMDPLLIKFENYFIATKYKFGVLYAAAGQTTEDEFFMNKNGSSHFEHFLELLGTKIKLQGFTGFSGGLDTKQNLTGEYAIMNTFSNNSINIIYHVAPYLPYSDFEKQQLDKKKHIGNDIVVLVFKEYHGKDPKQDTIDFSTFKTQFNHVFLVVGFDLDQSNIDTPKYSVNLMCKHDIKPIPPFITTDEYCGSQSFSTFLTAKLINSEVAAQESAQFRTKRVMIRNQLLTDMTTNSDE